MCVRACLFVRVNVYFIPTSFHLFVYTFVICILYEMYVDNTIGITESQPSPIVIVFNMYVNKSTFNLKGIMQ